MPLGLNKIFGLLVAVGGLILLSPPPKLYARSPGDLDPTFGDRGKVMTNFFDRGGADVALSMAIQGDGKIVVGGSAHNSVNADFAVARYNSDGSLDSSFGPGGTDGDGKVTVDFGGNDLIRALLIQENGRIVVAGSSDDRLALACLNPDGSLDTSSDSTPDSCSSDGKVIIDLGKGSEKAIYALALQGDGKIVFVGSASATTGKDLLIGRFKKTSKSFLDEDSLDSTFHRFGYELLDIDGLDDEARAVALQPVRGIEAFKILVAGYATVTPPYGTPHKDFVLARFLKNGQLDTNDDDGWGPVVDVPGPGTERQGFILRDWESESDDVATTLAIERDPAEPYRNRIYVAGYIEGSPEKMAMVHYTSAGNEIDFSTSVFTDSITSRAFAMALYPQNDEYVVIAGGARNDFALEQYEYAFFDDPRETGWSDTPLDENFSGGKVLTDFGGEEEAHAIAIQSDGKIVVAGSTYQGPNPDFALVRYIGMSADLSITLSCETPEVSAGNNVSYTVTVTNQGPYTFLNEAPLTIRLPSSFTSVVTSSHGIEGCTTTPPITCHWPSYLIDSGPLTLEVATNPSQATRRLRATAEVSSVVYDPSLENNYSNIVVRVLARPRRR